jgi:hypothetical protein
VPLEQIALVVAAIAFAAIIVFKSRPMVSGVATADGRAARAALKEAQERVLAAKDEAGKARALCDAGDAAAKLGKASSAVGFYLRALRTHPSSTNVVERAAVTFARRPGALENLMWRHLAHESIDRTTTIASLRVLAGVYAKKKRQHTRAKGLERVLALMSKAPSTADGG